MQCSRRKFLKLAGMGTLCLSLGQLGFNLEDALAYSRSLKIEGAKEVVTISVRSARSAVRSSPMCATASSSPRKAIRIFR